ITGGKTLPEEVMNQILARTDGVPLFVEELTKTVLESGVLQERDGHYVLEHPLPSLAIPTTLHDFVNSASRPVRAGAGCGTDRRRSGSLVLVRTAEWRSRDSARQAGGGARPAGSVGADIPPGRD